MTVPSGIRVQLLGGFRAFVDGRPIDRLPTLRQQQILACLALEAAGTPVPRQRIAGSLWPESTDAQALTNLRRELHHLREVSPALDGLIDAGSRTLALRLDAGSQVDVLAFEQTAARGFGGDDAAMVEAAGHYQGDLLPDCADEWIEPARARLRERAGQVLSRLVQVHEKERAFARATDYAKQLVHLDPLNEDAWCAVMRGHARRGERAAALHAYQQCAAVLKKELGIQPGTQTRMTYREVLNLEEAAPAPPAPPPRTSAYPLVGRDREWRTLLDAWHAADAGASRLVLIRGEAGIGKSRLAEELADWCRLAGHTVATARSYAGEGRLAYAPIAGWLKQEALQPSLLALNPTWLSDVARLRPELIAARPDVSRPEGPLESWQRLRLFDALAQAFLAAVPIALILDDVQWADADTLDWLQYFARAVSGRRGLVVATARAEEEQDNPPLRRLLEHLDRDGLLVEITLGALDFGATGQLVAAVAERPLDDAALLRAFDETEGHPLFIVERGRMESAGQKTTAGASAERSRVQAVVAARLTLLSPEARGAAEIAAAVGRDFRFDILAQASDLEEDALVRALDELWRRHIVRAQADERWDFSHDRIREVAYGGIGPARRRLIHRRIAQGMELLFANRLDDVSASMAMHLERGGLPARALPFLERAAAVATRVSAHEEAMRCLTGALTLLDALPAGPERDERELAIRSNLSVVLNSARGYGAPEVERNLDRVMRLARADHRDQVPVRWLWVGFTLRFMLGDLTGTRELAELALAHAENDPSCRCEAHHAMGGLLMSVGQLHESQAHFDAALAAYDEKHPQRSALGSDLGVFIRAWYSHTLCLLGDDAAALVHSDEAVTLARRRGLPYSETLALAYAALLHQMRGDTERLRASAQEVVTLCGRYGFAYYGDWAQVLLGWARGQEAPADGVQAIDAAIGRLDAHRARARRPYYLSLLADVHRLGGHVERATAILDTAIALALERSDLWWLPALLLQRAELDAAGGDTFRQRALDLARVQDSRHLELRLRQGLGGTGPGSVHTPA